MERRRRKHTVNILQDVVNAYGTERVKTTSMENDCTVVLGKNKTLFKSWKSGKPKKQGVIILWGVEIYANAYAQR